MLNLLTLPEEIFNTISSFSTPALSSLKQTCFAWNAWAKKEYRAAPIVEKLATLKPIDGYQFSGEYATSHDGSCIAAICNSGAHTQLVLFDTARPISPLSAKLPNNYSYHSLVFSPDDEYLLFIKTKHGVIDEFEIELWSVDMLKHLETCKCTEISGEPIFLSNQFFIMSTPFKKSLSIYEITWENTIILTGGLVLVKEKDDLCVLSPDRSQILKVNKCEPTQIILSVLSGFVTDDTVLPLDAHFFSSSMISEACFSNDNTQIALACILPDASDRTSQKHRIYIVDSKTGSIQKEISLHATVNQMVWVGNTLLLQERASDTWVSVWDVESSHCIHRQKGRLIQFSPGKGKTTVMLKKVGGKELEIMQLKPPALARALTTTSTGESSSHKKIQRPG